MTDKLGIAPNAPLEMVEWRIDGEPYGDDQRGYRCRFVPYIDGRDAAQLLDEWVGPENWRDDYEEGTLAGKPVLWGIVSIRFGDDWVTKKDVGVAPNFEAQKGIVSDAFKRTACVKWGVGRNVWSLPTIWAPCDTYRRNDKLIGKANDKTLPAILAELKNQGYEASGGRVADEVSEEGASTRKGEETVERGKSKPSSDANKETPEGGVTSAAKPSSPSGAPSEQALDLVKSHPLGEIIKAAARLDIDIKSKASVMVLTDEQATAIASEVVGGTPA